MSLHVWEVLSAVRKHLRSSEFVYAFFPVIAGDNKAPMVAAEEEDDEVPGKQIHTSHFQTKSCINSEMFLSSRLIQLLTVQNSPMLRTLYDFITSTPLVSMYVAMWIRFKTNLSHQQSLLIHSEG